MRQLFSSLPLALKLQKEKISIVLRKNRREIAKKMTDAVKGNLHCSQFYWHKNNDMLFVKYQAKAKKTVCLLSSMHHSPDIDQSSVKQKPQVILFYNNNKVGVDCFDQMSRLYSTRSASRRWPLTVWGNILDIVAINARVIFMKSTGMQISRRNFLLKLIEELTAKQTTMQSRESSDKPICSVNSTRKRRRCSVYGCENATVSLCMLCDQPTCGKCSQDGSRIIYVKCNKCMQSLA